jgi:hypothetical protein
MKYILDMPKGCKEARFFCWNEKQGQYIIIPAKKAMAVHGGISRAIATQFDKEVDVYAVEKTIQGKGG